MIRLFWWLCNVFIVFGLFCIGNARAVDQKKDWTFLVYINGNNDLDAYGQFNINQMERVGSTEQVNVVVQWASTANQKTQRLFITQDRDNRKVTSPVMEGLGKVDMGDWHTLVSFIQWGVEHYPAKHYFIDVWDHGSGWHDLKLKSYSPNFNPMDISHDDHSKNMITTPQLGQAMSEAARIMGHKVDIYGSDACLMAMAEIASEMKNSVHYFIGSEEIEPGEGWPYDAILAEWNKKNSTSAEEVAKIVTNEYVKSYQGGGGGSFNSYNEVTFSAFNLEKTERMYSAVSALGAYLRRLDRSKQKKVVQAFARTQMFYHSDYRDFLDLFSQLEKLNLIELSKEVSLQGVKDAIHEYVIVNRVTTDYAQATGLSIWLPTKLSTYKSYSEYYSTLQFQHDTRWGDALREVLQAAAVSTP